MNDRLDFVLTEIKRDYNTNDRLKFILSIITICYESIQNNNGPLRVHRMN